MTAPQRWEPDAQMVAAVLSMPKASRKMTELSELDRSWLVAGLTLAGVTAQDIADRMGCSLRLVRAIRAESITQFAVVAQTESHALGNELRAERCEHAVTRRTLAEAERDNERLRTQLDQLVEAHAAGTLELFRCKHPRVKYNVYRHGGKDYCRTCRREYQANRRRASAPAQAAV